MQGKNCPKCNSELVRDFLNRFIRCINCGWYQKIIEDLTKKS